MTKFDVLVLKCLQDNSRCRNPWGDVFLLGIYSELVDITVDV